MAKLGKGGTKDRSSKTDWAASIAAQHSASKQVRDVLVKTLPLDSIRADEDNPRSLAITAQEIKLFVSEHPFLVENLTRSARDYVEAYIELVERHSGLSGKSLGDFIGVIEFAASLRSADELIQPIAVWREGTCFHLVIGERRWLAHHVLQAQTIAARIYQARPEQFIIDKMQWDENESRERMNLWDRLCRVEKIITNYYSLAEASKTTLATLIGKSPSESARYLSVLRCKNPALKKAIQEGRVNNLTQAEKLAGKSGDELLQALKGEKTTAKIPVIKFGKTGNIAHIQHFISTVAEAFHCQHIIDDKNLNTHKDCAEVMEIMITVLANQANNNKGRRDV